MSGQEGLKQMPLLWQAEGTGVKPPYLIAQEGVGTRRERECRTTHEDTDRS